MELGFYILITLLLMMSVCIYVGKLGVDRIVEALSQRNKVTVTVVPSRYYDEVVGD